MTTEKQLTLSINNVNIPYTLAESRRSKYIRLTINSGGLKIVKPHRAKLDEVYKLIEKKSQWLYKNFIKFQSVTESAPKREWKNGETLSFLGKEYELSVVKHKKKSAGVKFTGEQFEVAVYDGLDQLAEKKALEKALRKWFIENARQYLMERLEYFCRVIGVAYNEIRIKEQKSRWGSCSKQGNLNFNWRLIMAPEDVVDYVIVHELCHIKHLNHSKDFWKLVESHMPGYKLANKWLKENGAALRF